MDRGSRSSQFLPLSPTFVKNFYFISIYRVFITQKGTFLIPYVGISVLANICQASADLAMSESVMYVRSPRM